MKKLKSHEGLLIYLSKVTTILQMKKILIHEGHQMVYQTF
jgi:hypothetical protein